VPSFAFAADGSPYSTSPEAKAPVVLYQVFTGDLRLTQAQNVFEFDETGMTPGAGGVLLPGQQIALPGGATITWEGFRDYAVFQTTRNPGTRAAFLACVFGLLGLIASLFVRRRRIWVRASPTGGGTVVAVGGLARHDAERFRAEFAALTSVLSGKLTATEHGQPDAVPTHVNDLVQERVQDSAEPVQSVEES
jgi:cytochrome c biogenesis protein